MAIEPGSIVGGYRIEAVIGRGGMGVVYRATELALDRPVALKLIAPRLAGDARFRDRFVRESHLAASIDHPGVLPVYAVGEADGELFLATRFVDGIDLSRLLQEAGPLELDRALDIVGQIAGALDAAHARGLVHRDVKPANVLVDGTGHCYLCDFGLTKQLNTVTTSTGGLLGTVDYLAPEQIRDEMVGAPADQYSLAVLLYESLAGAAPFRRSSDVQTLFAHVQESVAPLSSRRTGLPKALDTVLSRGLAKNQADRYPTCSALVEDARAAAGLAETGHVTARRRPRIHGRHLAVGAAVLGLVLLALVAALIVANGRDGPLTASANSVAAVDPVTRRVVAVVPVGRGPTEIVGDENAVWVLNGSEGAGTISRVDPATKQVTRTLAVPGTPRNLALADGSLWVGTAEGKVLRIDPESGTTDRSWTLRNAGKHSPFVYDPGAGWLAAGRGSVWASTLLMVSRIDVQTSAVRATKSSAYGALAYGFGSLWAVGVRALDRLDPETGQRVARIPITVGNFGFPAQATAVWIADDEGGVVVRVDPQRNTVARTIDVAGHPYGVDAGAGAVWAAVAEGTVVRIDPLTNATTAVHVGGRPRGVAVAAGLVWVTVD